MAAFVKALSSHIASMNQERRRDVAGQLAMMLGGLLKVRMGDLAEFAPELGGASLSDGGGIVGDFAKEPEIQDLSTSLAAIARSGGIMHKTVFDALPDLVKRCDARIRDCRRDIHNLTANGGDARLIQLSREEAAMHGHLASELERIHEICQRLLHPRYQHNTGTPDARGL